MTEWLSPFKNYKIEDRSFVSFVKREIHNQLVKAKFVEKQIGHVDIIVSEITSNLVKHAGGGELLYRIRNQEAEANAVFDLISVDSGPGMADPGRMVKDGVSTAGTLGQGLGAIHRLSDKSQLYTIPSWGTLLYSCVGHEAPRTIGKTFEIDIRALNINKPRETVCGDGYRFVKTESGAMLFLGDGLGHGPHAKAAVDTAGEFFLTTTERDPVNILRQMHERVRATRGLVAVVAVFNAISNEWKICGIGNISTRLYTGPGYKTYTSYNGTVGLIIPNSMNASTYPVERNQRLILCSDGINSRWDLSRYPAIFRYDDLLAASALYKDFSRGNDDTSVVIAKVS